MVLFWVPKLLQMVTVAIKLKDGLLFGRKVMTNLDSTLKSRHITLPTKVYLFSYFNRNMEEAGFFFSFLMMTQRKQLMSVASLINF